MPDGEKPAAGADHDQGGMTAADPLGDSAWSPMGFGGTYCSFGKVCEKDEVKIWGWREKGEM